MTLIELGREHTQSGGTGSSDHGRVLIAQLDELLPQSFLLLAGPVVARVEELAA